MSIFIKLKSEYSREIILIMFDKILKIGSHLHSLKDDFDIRLQRQFQHYSDQLRRPYLTRLLLNPQSETPKMFSKIKTKNTDFKMKTINILNVKDVFSKIKNYLIILRFKHGYFHILTFYLLYFYF